MKEGIHEEIAAEKRFAYAKRVVICATLTKIHQCLNVSVLENLSQKSLFVKFETLT